MAKKGFRKYKNEKTQVDGVWFDSKREARRYGELKLLERAGEIRNLRLQVVYDLVVYGRLVCRYRADFVYEDRRLGWAEVVEDAKGCRTEAYIIKRKLMLAVHGITIREV